MCLAGFQFQPYVSSHQSQVVKALQILIHGMLGQEDDVTVDQVRVSLHLTGLQQRPHTHQVADFFFNPSLSL